jgi:hypothetical protein
MAYQAAETAAREGVKPEEPGRRRPRRDADAWNRICAMLDAAAMVSRWNPPPGVRVSVALRLDDDGPAEVGYMLDACCSEASGLIPAQATTAEIDRILDGAATGLLLENARAHAEKKKAAGSLMGKLSDAADLIREMNL